MQTPDQPALAPQVSRSLYGATSFSFGVSQEYDTYQDADHAVWRILMSRQQQNLPGMASDRFLQGVQQVGFVPEAIPDFRQTNQLLMQLTGWSLVPVPGIVDDAIFFELLSKRLFPATTWLRPMSSLDYLEEPDMFHDVYGHVPLLAEPAFASFLERLGKLALPFAHDEAVTHLISRLYWYTVEFGLIQEENGLRIYGAGILSSASESAYSLGLAEQKPEHRAFDLQRVLDTPYRKDSLQTVYYAIQSYEQLYHSLDELKLGK